MSRNGKGAWYAIGDVLYILLGLHFMYDTCSLKI